MKNKMFLLFFVILFLILIINFSPTLDAPYNQYFELKGGNLSDVFVLGEDNTNYGQGYIVKGKTMTFGVKTYSRWDNEWRPKEELEVTSGDWTYLVEEYPTYYNLTRMGKTIKLPKKGWLDWEFKLDKIRPKRITVNSLTNLETISEVHNSTVRYIEISEQINNPVYSGKLIKIGEFTWDSELVIYDSNDNYAPEDSFSFKVVNGNLRLYAETDWFLSATYPVYLEFNTWTVPTDSAWSTGTFDNTTEDRGDHHLKLGLLRDNFNDEDEDLTCTGATKGVTDRGTFYFNVTSSGHYCYYADTNFTGLYLYADITPVNSSNVASTQHVGLTMRYMNQTSTYHDVTRKRNGVRFYINNFGPSGTSGFTFVNTYNMWFWFNESANTNLTARWSGAEGDWTISNASYRPSESGYIGFRLDKLDAEWDNFMALSVDNNGNPKLDGNYTTATRDSGSGNEAKDVRINLSDYDQQKVNVSVYINHTLIQENVTNATVYTISSGYRTYNITVSLISTDANETPIINTIEVGEGSSPDTTKPSIEIITPLEGNTTTTQDNLFQFKYNDGTDALNVSLWGNFSGVFEFNSTNSSAIELNGYGNISVDDLADNTTYYYTYNYSDSVGNWNFTQYDNGTVANFTFSIATYVPDTTAPDISLSYPLNGSINSTDDIYFGFNANDSVSGFLNASLFTNLSGSFSFNGTNLTSIYNNSITQFLLSDIEDGTYGWYVNISDSLGNWRNSGIETFTVDTTAPNIQQVFPTNLSTNESADIYFGINLTDSLSPILNASFYHNFSGGYVFNGTNSSAIVNNTEFALFVEDFTNGTVGWYVNTSDILGNWKTSGVYIVIIEIAEITIDTDTPDVLLKSPTNGSTNISNDINFGVLAYDDTAFLNLTIWGNFSGTFERNASNSSAITNNTEFTILVSDLADGTYQWTANVSDGSGNWNMTQDNDGTVLNYTLTIDSTAPDISLSYPLNGSINSTDDIYMGFEVNDSISDILNASLWTNLSGSYAFNGTNLTAISNNTIEQFLLSDVEDGTYGYYVNVSDIEGNWRNSGIETFTVDTTNPSNYFVSPTDDDGDSVNRNWSYVNVSVSDDISNVSSFINWNNSLVGYWSFDDYNSTGIYDNSTYDNFGEFIGGLSTSNITIGKFGNAMSFNGSNVGVGVEDNTILEPENITITAWFKRHDDQTEWRALVTKALSTNSLSDSYFLGFYGNVLRFHTYNGTSNELNYQTLDNNKWYFVAATYDGSTKRLYLNGTEVKSASWSGPISYGSGRFAIGQNFNYDIFYPQFDGFNGTIDEVMVFNRALSQEEITALYNGTKTYHNFTNLAEGSYEYYAYAIDSAGNTNQTETRSLTVDTTAPSITVNSPINETTTDNTPLLNVSLTETYPDRLLYSLDSGANETINTTGTAGLINLSKNWIVGVDWDNWAGNTTRDNTTEDLGDHEIKLGLFADNFDDNDTSGWTLNSICYAKNNSIYCNGKNDQAILYDGQNFTNITFMYKYDVEGNSSNTGTPSITGKVGYVNSTYWMEMFKEGSIYNNLLIQKYPYASLKTVGDTTPELRRFPNDTYTEIRYYPPNMSVRDWNETKPNWEINYSSVSSVYAKGYIGFRINLRVFIDDVRVIYTNPSGTQKLDGNITSISKDAEEIGISGDVWNHLRIEGTIPDGTNVSIYVNTSSDDGSSDAYSGYVLVKEDISIGTSYDLPSANQERYGRWMLFLQTNDSVKTPEISSVSMGVALEDGNHNVSVYANDTVGNINDTIQYFTVDTTPPGISIIYPLNVTMNGTDDIYIGFNANDSLSEFLNASLFTNLSGTFQFNGTNLTAITNNTIEQFLLSDVEEGVSYGFYVNISDSLGNWITSGIEVFGVDTTAPTIETYEQSPANSSTWSSGLEHKFNITCSDTNGCDNSLIEFDGTNYTNTSFVNGEYEFNIGGLTAGTYKIKFYTNDTLGNMQINDTGSYVLNKITDSFQVFINNTTPTYPQGVKTGCGDSVYGLTVNQRINGTITANETEATYGKEGDWNISCASDGNVNVSDLKVESSFTYTKATGSITQFTNVTSTEETKGILAYAYSPSHTATVTMYRNGTVQTNNTVFTTTGVGTLNFTSVIDSTENYTSASDEVLVNVVDGTAPDISLSYPLNGSVNGTNDISFMFNVNDSLSAILNASLWTNLSGSFAFNETNASVINNNSFNQVTLSDIEDGTYGYYWNVSDVLGNWQNSGIETFNVDTTVPDVSLIKPSDNSNLATDDLKFWYETNDSISKILNASLWTNLSGTWSFNATNRSRIDNNTEYYISLNDIEDGEYIWNVNVSDEAGNWNFASSNFSFTINISVVSFNLGTDKATYKENDLLIINGTVTNTGSYDLNGSLSSTIYDKYGLTSLGTMSCNSTSLTLNTGYSEGVNCTWDITNLLADNYISRFLYNWTLSYATEDISFNIISAKAPEVSITEAEEEKPREEVSVIEEPIIVVDRFGRTVIDYIKISTRIRSE